MTDRLPEGDAMRLVLPCRPDYLLIVRRTVREFASMAGFAPAEVDDVVSAVDEACANVIRHGYGGPTSRPLAIECKNRTDGLEVRLRDFGRHTDPQQLRPGATKKRPAGGLGLVIIYEAMDEVNYASKPEGMELTMFKSFGTERSSGDGS
ncbi:MAG TPA: ATP-binding protein [Candidatus Brocadiia bacterium]|nr:ATP-binding protein [Candidatus Brocadiia bacterium]